MWKRRVHHAATDVAFESANSPVCVFDLSDLPKTVALNGVRRGYFPVSNSFHANDVCTCIELAARHVSALVCLGHPPWAVLERGTSIVSIDDFSDTTEAIGHGLREWSK